MMPARDPATGDTGGPPALEAMLAYASYGLSVIPILPGTKKPLGKVLPEGRWGTYQHRRATEEEITNWIRMRPDSGVGVVCGEVSDYLYCLDCDDTSFSGWIEGMVDELASHGAWVVRSGSGKLHVWVRSRTKMLTTHLIGQGRKIADLRGDGQERNGPSYIVVPPSVHPDTGQPYTTIAGSPEHLGYVKDARALFDRLRDAWQASAGGPPPTDAPPDETYAEADAELNDRTVLPTATDEQWAAFTVKIRSNLLLPRRTKQALLEGAEFGVGAWSGAPTQSEVDHTVIRDLREAGFTRPEIEQAFAWSPLGNSHYRRTGGTCGRGYLTWSLRRIDAKANAAREALQSARGVNFAVTKVVRIGFEEPTFELHITASTNPPKQGRVLVRVEDLMDEYRFKREVAKTLNFFPQMDGALAGRKFEKFGALLLTMATDEVVPETATIGGHLKSVVMAFIASEAAPREPEDKHDVTLGWRNGTAAYIRGGALLQRLQNVIHPAPKPDQVWSTLRRLGAEELGHRWPDGVTEPVWAVPLQKPATRDE